MNRHDFAEGDRVITRSEVWTGTVISVPSGGLFVIVRWDDPDCPRVTHTWYLDIRKVA